MVEHEAKGPHFIKNVVELEVSGLPHFIKNVVELEAMGPPHKKNSGRA